VSNSRKADTPERKKDARNKVEGKVGIKTRLRPCQPKRFEKDIEQKAKRRTGYEGHRRDSRGLVGNTLMTKLLGGEKRT